MSINYSHLPAWLERNPIFRRLFLFRKLRLIKSKFGHYSQFAEDISIGRLFPRDYRGFFVDVGCFHPKKYSNTWLLYKRGWRGINVDIDPIKIEGFHIVRRGDINICCAVSNIEGEVPYFSQGFYAGTTSVDKSFAEGKEGYVQKKTRCARLTTLIDGTKYKDREIDFLSVDTEGHDAEVLASLDFARYRPKLIAVETHHPLFTDVCQSPLYQFLVAKEYCLVGWCGLTLLMASKAFQGTLGGE